MGNNLVTVNFCAECGVPYPCHAAQCPACDSREALPATMTLEHAAALEKVRKVELTSSRPSTFDQLATEMRSLLLELHPNAHTLGSQVVIPPALSDSGWESKQFDPIRIDPLDLAERIMLKFTIEPKEEK